VYTRLKYHEAWDRNWRVGETADVVVRFDESDDRFVFWRGTSYIPCWVTGDGKWYTNEFNETWEKGVEGCAEPMSDKQCRHSHVRIIASHNARAVVHWRYGLVDNHYRFAFLDPDTRWGDWSDETYTIYPDGIGVRTIKLWSSHPAAPHEFQESIIINPPGTRPEDNIETEALTMVNMKGETWTYSWAEGAPAAIDRPAKANIEVINLKSSKKPFLVVSDDNAQFRPYGGEIIREHSIFPWWNHWPAAQIASDGRWARFPDRVSHTSLTTYLQWEPLEMTENSQTRVMLHGLTEREPAALVPLARSWLHPPELRLQGTGYASKGYDSSQRAYVLRRLDPDSPTDLEIEIAASDESPLFNPALVIEDWGDRTAQLVLDGQAVPWDADHRHGLEHGLDGTELVIWLRKETIRPLRLTVQPAE
jgi:hypothetical protein